MTSVENLLADNIVNQVGEKVDWMTITGKGKILGLYYSAHWCPPCRGFTPKLAEWYKGMKAKDAGKNFEMIFVSSDSDQAAFDEYYKEMPWLALKFDKRQEKADLSKKHGVRGIPTLVILNAETGAVITSKGRAKVTSEPDNFPWYPENFTDIFYSGDFVKNDGTVVKASELKGKVKGVYFSAHWCPPCRGFTPSLIKSYNSLKETKEDNKQKKEFEIVFASSDRDEKSFKEYFVDMPWLALPFGDSRKEKLSDFCNVEGIPMLALFDEEDNKITFNGRAAVGGDPECKDFPWLPKPLNELTDDSAGSVNEKACFVYFNDGEEKSMEQARVTIKPIADKEFNKDQDQQDLLFFYTGNDDDDLIDSLKTFTKLNKKENPFVAIVNIPSQEVTEYTGELTTEGLTTFVNDFKAGKLEPRSL